MSNTSESNPNKIGLYPVDLVVGNVGTPGAPILHLSLLVNAVNGNVTGQGEVTQAVNGPYANVKISNITGRVRATGFGKYTKVVALKGEAVISMPPPAIGSYLAPFEAHLSVDNDWSGEGGWTLGVEHVDGVPVKKD